MEIPYTVTARPDTGLWNAKVGIWLFLASEVMLFGGLFSSYVFLRIGADYPWPMHELDVKFGFINTLVLIASSVFVVYAWVALKMRNWGLYQIWMTLVVLSAGLFLVNKSIEYKSKFNHFHAKLDDHSIVAGHLPDGVGKEGRSIIFEANEVIVDHASGGHHFLSFIENESDVTFTTLSGEEVNPNRKWFERLKKAQSLLTEADDLAADGDSAGSDKLNERISEDFPAFALFDGQTTLALKATPAAKFILPPNKVFAWEDSKLEMARKYATNLNGKLISDKLHLQIDEVDLRVYLRHDEPKDRSIDDAAIFTYFDDEAEKKATLEGFKRVHEQESAKYEAKVAKWQAKNPGVEYKERTFLDHDKLMLKDLPDHHGDDDVHAEGAHEQQAAAGGHAGGHHGPVLSIPFSEIRFFSNYGPRKNTFNAIYFTMTGLHGLHVLGGMFVLGYFLVFGRALYLKNPEHMANRVEVGGLFWHFVDLVWIFLFPIFYLM